MFWCYSRQTRHIHPKPLKNPSSEFGSMSRLFLKAKRSKRKLYPILYIAILYLLKVLEWYQRLLTPLTRIRIQNYVWHVVQFLRGRLFGEGEYVTEQEKRVLSLAGKSTYAEVPAVDIKNTSFALAGWIYVTNPFAMGHIFSDWSHPFQFRLYVYNGALRTDLRRTGNVGTNLLNMESARCANVCLWVQNTMHLRWEVNNGKEGVEGLTNLRNFYYQRKLFGLVTDTTWFIHFLFMSSLRHAVLSRTISFFASYV